MTIELHRHLFSKGYKAPVIFFIRHIGAMRTDRRKGPPQEQWLTLSGPFDASALLYAIRRAPKSG
jgi:hypothetical protein